MPSFVLSGFSSLHSDPLPFFFSCFPFLCPAGRSFPPARLSPFHLLQPCVDLLPYDPSFLFEGGVPPDARPPVVGQLAEPLLYLPTHSL